MWRHVGEVDEEHEESEWQSICPLQVQGVWYASGAQACLRLALQSCVMAGDW